MVKIYVQNKPLYLTNRITAEIEDYLHRPETIFIDELNASAVKTMLQALEQPEFYTGVFLYPDLKALLEGFKAQLQVVIAAGGLVYTSEQEALLIFRRGKWDLPKGKLDAGESIEACALREIEEETGVDGLTIEQPLQTTYHTYYENGRQVLKESHWYLVKAGKKAVLTPQVEEDIEQCIWVPFLEIPAYLDRAFFSVADVLKEGLSKLETR